MKKKLTSLLGVAAFGTLTPCAFAVPTIYIDYGNNGTIDTTWVDNAAGDNNANAGRLQFNENSGSFQVSVESRTKPAIGSAGSPMVATSTVSVLSGGAGSIAIYFSETGFNFTPGTVMSQTTYNPTSGGAGISATYEAYANASNTLRDTSGGAITSLTTSGNGVQLNMGDGKLNVPLGSTYSITDKIVITFGGSGGELDFDASSSVVPDGGATVSLLGLSLLGVGLGRRAMRRKS